MSKHPIDDLFARQLRDHGVKPQHASWEGLQRRMNAQENRRTPFVWWYAAAASVAVVMLAAWWLWSGVEPDSANPVNQSIAKQIPKKTAPALSKPDAPQVETVPPVEEPVVAYQKPEVPIKKRSTATKRTESQEIAPINDQKPVFTEQPVVAATEEVRKPEEPIVAVTTPKQPERTLVVQVATPEVKPAGGVIAYESSGTEVAESDEDQPKKKRFRIGRVLRQFNKLRAGERIEWEEMGVQPGALMAKATEKVQEGKEKITDSYENLRYNTFRKNSNNK